MASVRSIDSALSISLTDNGRILRNLIHGADTVMSHILHFYHLAAADFVDVSALGGPWNSASGTAFGATDGAAQLVSLTTKNTYNYGATNELVESYVRALNARKDAHAMGAIFSGRHPIQNAIVPGGVSTLFTQNDIDTFRGKLNSIRNFINDFYIPDVVFVASRTSLGWHNYWNVGVDPGNLLSYGEYPDTSAGNLPFATVGNSDMLLARGAIVTPLGAGLGGFTDMGTNLSLADIKEYVDYSFYTSGNALNPSVGATTPMTGTTLTAAMSGATQQYSWLKAPRYKGYAMEVGPLARMIASYVTGNTKKVHDQAGGILGCRLLVTTLSMPENYGVQDIVQKALAGVNAVAGTTVTATAKLYSPLGRHAARALECKFVADAMYGWVGQLSLNNLTNDTTHSYVTPTATGSGYNYVQIPKATKHGTGLAEAPRGALGHWITIQNQKIANYQCVVPSTWNCGPKAVTAEVGFTRGPAEAAVVSLGTAHINAGGGANPVNNAICNIARMLHPYDFCIACAVHVVTPEGKDVAKFKMDLDGKVSRIPLDSE